MAEEKSPREIAALIPQFWLDEARNGVALATVLLKQDEEMLIGAIEKALRDRDERAVRIAQSEAMAAAAQLTERGDEGRDILNYTDFIKGQKTAAQDIASAIRGKS